MFRALMLRKDHATPLSAQVSAAVENLPLAMLPEGDISVAIRYSTLNYKDALAITGQGPVVQHYPMIPGIDLAGVVVDSNDATLPIGMEVIANGWGLGERHWGGLAQRANLQRKWLLPCPEGLTLHDTMALGTAGYTAMLCIMALKAHGITPASGDVVVTGASGGVGSIAIALLAAMGFDVVAVTGQSDQADYLYALGAKRIESRASFSTAGKPLQKAQYAAGIDTAGSHTLANLCARIHYGGAVAACGLAQGAELPASVMPFILRNIVLIGIDSVMRPLSDRQRAWQQLAYWMPRALLPRIAPCTFPLSNTIEAAQQLLQGQHHGRAVIDVNA